MSKKKGLKLEKSNSIVITFKLENVLLKCLILNINDSKRSFKISIKYHHVMLSTYKYFDILNIEYYFFWELSVSITTKNFHIT